jgi:hypothetical protein
MKLTILSISALCIFSAAEIKRAFLAKEKLLLVEEIYNSNNLQIISPIENLLVSMDDSSAQMVFKYSPVKKRRVPRKPIKIDAFIEPEKITTKPIRIKVTRVKDTL